MLRHRFRAVTTPVAVLSLVLCLAGSVPAVAQQGVATLARCQQLMAAWDRYYPRYSPFASSLGGQLDRNLAEVQCARGEYTEGIRTMEALLKRNLLAIPPP